MAGTTAARSAGTACGRNCGVLILVSSTFAGTESARLYAANPRPGAEDCSFGDGWFAPVLCDAEKGGMDNFFIFLPLPFGLPPSLPHSCILRTNAFLPHFFL